MQGHAASDAAPSEDHTYELQQIEKSRTSMLKEIEELTLAKAAWEVEKAEDEARVARRKARDEEERSALEEVLRVIGGDFFLAWH